MRETETEKEKQRQRKRKRASETEHKRPWRVLRVPAEPFNVFDGRTMHAVWS